MKRSRPTSKILAACCVLAAGLTVAAAAWPARSDQSRSQVFVRGCATQPAGVSVPASYRRSSVATGPLSLYSFGQLRDGGHRSAVPATRFRPVRGGRFRVYKLWALLPPGRGATLSVPGAERGAVSLAYDPSLWNRSGWDGTASVSQGEASVRFRGCPRSRAQGSPPLVVYDGGLIVAGARCARLQVRATGGRRPRTIVLALGRPQC